LSNDNADAARKLWDEVANTPHYHVLALASHDFCLVEYFADYTHDFTIVHTVLQPDHGGEPGSFFMGYTDAHERVNALGYAADLIAPTAGLRWLSR